MLVMNINEILYFKSKKRIKYNPIKKTKNKIKKKKSLDKKFSTLKLKFNNTKSSIKGINKDSFSKFDIKSKSISIYNNKKKKKILKKIFKNKFFNDYELNSLPFKYALKYEKDHYYNIIYHYL